MAMFITETLDVAIGLTLIYLLVSLAMTSLSEAIEGFFKKRAVSLERAVGELLRGKREDIAKFYEHPLVAALYPGVYPALSEDGAKRARWTGKNLPSYIPRDIFSAVVLDLHARDELPEDMRHALRALTASAGIDLAAKRRAIESWYDAAMDRAAGWYRRHTQARLFWLALPLAILANINSVVIADYLTHAPEARKAAAAVGASAAQRAPGWTKGVGKPSDSMAAPATTDGASQAADRDRYAADYRAQLDRIGLPIGWQSSAEAQTLSLVPPYEDGFVGWLTGSALLIMGYLLTTLAIMLGAPFWFDMLGRLVVIRSTIKPKEKSPDEASKDGGVAYGTSEVRKSAAGAAMLPTTGV